MGKRTEPPSNRAPLLLIRVEPDFLEALDRLAKRLGASGRAEMARELMRRGLVLSLEDAERRDIAEVTRRALEAAGSPRKGVRQR